VVDSSFFFIAVSIGAKTQHISFVHYDTATCSVCKLHEFFFDQCCQTNREWEIPTGIYLELQPCPILIIGNYKLCTALSCTSFVHQSTLYNTTCSTGYTTKLQQSMFLHHFCTSQISQNRVHILCTWFVQWIFSIHKERM